MSRRALASRSLDLPDLRVDASTLQGQRLDRLREVMANHDVGMLVLGSPANVMYATGYRSVAADLFRAHQMVALVTQDELLLILGIADSAPAIDSGLRSDQLVVHGTFFYETASGETPEPATQVGEHDSIESAILEGFRRLEPAGHQIGIDESGLGVALGCVEEVLADGSATVGASPVTDAARAVKLPGEIERLERAAKLSEAGIATALEVAAAGVAETDLADAVAATMVAGGARPTFVVATAGHRTALADTFPDPSQTMKPGDLLRFDVGCRVDGYHADMARSAVLGDPSPRQQRLYDALLAGEEAQLDLVSPGVAASEVFDVAVQTVEAHGLAPYRRHHCGHAIGSEVYERPIISPDHDTPLRAGMTFCLETPFYELGWGGMMVEDTIVVTDDGHRRFTTSDRSLRRVEP